jgi:mitochondrial fission protein ELM1
VWCLLGRKAGDNTQVRALADELGFGYQEKHILARPWELLAHVGHAATLAGIDRRASSPLAPPWPDLVISAGRRNEPVARWIKRQSGGRTRLVHIGRPWAPLAEWDLVVTTPQYFLPEQANILHNTLPLHRLSRADLKAAATALRPRLAGLPRPWIAVLVGGDSGRFVLTEAKGRRLADLASKLAAASGGSLLVSDSPRTPKAAGDALQTGLAVPHFCHRWGDVGDNPYRGLLALADAFVVTGESMSMLGEAVATGRPLFIFDVGDGAVGWWRLAHNYRYKPLSHRFAMRFGPRRMRRDVGNIQAALVGSGQAEWLQAGGIDEAARSLAAAGGKMQVGAPGPAGPSAAQRELQLAAAAVRRLVTAR